MIDQPQWSNQECEERGMRRTRFQEDQEWIARLQAELQAAQERAERFSKRWLCDCHTWPDPDEAHAYIVALEEREKALREAAKAVLDYEHHPTRASLSKLRSTLAAQRTEEADPGVR